MSRVGLQQTEGHWIHAEASQICSHASAEVTRVKYMVKTQWGFDH